MAKSSQHSAGDSIEHILAEYREKLSTYDEFATACRVLVEKLLRPKEIRVHSVTCRAKTKDRLREKLARPEKEYGALTDITDLAGVRIITHFADEVDDIATIIEREFAVIPEESIDKRQVLDPDRFGYLSLHYVCTLPGRRTRLAEYSPYRGLICEIQVRSVLQHAWAEIEHDLGYKSPEAIPRPIRRRFSRLAALLETADDEFMRIRDELARYASEVRKDIDEKPREVLLDKVSLAVFIDRDATVRRMDKEMADFIGAGLKKASELVAEVYLERLSDVGMDTVEHLRAALTKREKVVIRQFRDRVGGQESYPPHLTRGVSIFHLWQVMLAEKGDLEQFIAAHERAEAPLGPDPIDGAATIVNAVQRALEEERGD